MGEHKRKKPKTEADEPPGMKEFCEALGAGLIKPINELHDWAMGGVRAGGPAEVRRRHEHVGRLASGFLQRVASGVALGRAESDGGPLVMAVQLTFLRSRDLERRFFEDVVLGPTAEERARAFRALAVGSPREIEIACRQLEEARQLIEEEQPGSEPATAGGACEAAFEVLRRSIVGAVVDYSWAINRWVQATPPLQGRDEALRRYHAGHRTAEQTMRAMLESFAEWHRNGLATITLGERLQEWIDARPENRASFWSDVVGASDPAQRERAISKIAGQLDINPAILRSELTAMVERLRETSAADDKGTGELLEELRELHARVHRDDTPPSTDAERQATLARTSILRTMEQLIVAGVSPMMLEHVLFEHWLRLTTLNHSLPEATYHAWASDMPGFAAPLIDMLKALVPSLKDEGPSDLMAALGETVEALKAMLDLDRTMPREATAEQGTKAFGAMFDAVRACLDAEVDPGLIEVTVLYYWLRVSTINAGTGEEFFQRAERNWPAVVAAVHQLVEASGPQPAAPRPPN